MPCLVAIAQLRGPVMRARARVGVRGIEGVRAISNPRAAASLPTWDGVSNTIRPRHTSSTRDGSPPNRASA
jgi:hypothetical protein